MLVPSTVFLQSRPVAEVVEGADLAVLEEVLLEEVLLEEVLLEEVLLEEVPPVEREVLQEGAQEEERAEPERVRRQLLLSTIREQSKVRYGNSSRWGTTGKRWFRFVMRRITLT